MAEADKKHEVRTIFTLVDEASEKSEKIAGKMEKAHEASEKLSRRMEGFVGPGLAMVGLGLGAGELAHKLYEVSEAAEHAERGIAAAILTSNRFSKLGPTREFATSLERASKAYEDIEDMADKGVTSTENYYSIFRTLAAPALTHTKATQEDILELTKNIAPAMIAVTGSFEGAAEQTQALGFALAGIAARPPKELLKITNLTRLEWEKLQKKGPETLFRAVKQRVEEAGGPMAKLFTGPEISLIRIRNTADHFMHTLGAPAMEELSKEAEKLEKWLSANKDQAREIAHQFVDKVVTGIHEAVTAAKFLSAHWKPILIGLGMMKAAPAAFSIAGMAAKILPAMTGTARAVGNWNNTVFGASMGMAKTASASEKVAGAFATAGLATLAFTLGYKLGTFIDTLTGASDGISKWVYKKFSKAGDDKLVETAASLNKTQLDARRQQVINKQRELMAKGISYEKALYRAEQELVYHRDPVAIAQEMAARANKAGGLDKSGEFAKGWHPEKAVNQFDFRGSKFDIKQAFAEGFDPDRVAVGFANDLASYGERRVQSNFSPLFSVR